MSNRIMKYLYIYMFNRITNYCYFFRYKQDYLHSSWIVLLITWTYSYCYLKSYSQIKEKWKFAIILWIGDKALVNQISTYQPTGWPKIIDQGTAESRPGLLHKGKGWKLPYLWINQVIKYTKTPLSLHRNTPDRTLGDHKINWSCRALAGWQHLLLILLTWKWLRRVTERRIYLGVI